MQPLNMLAVFRLLLTVVLTRLPSQDSEKYFSTSKTELNFNKPLLVAPQA